MGPPTYKLLFCQVVSLLIAYTTAADLVSNAVCTQEEPKKSDPERPKMDYSYTTQISGKWISSNFMEYIYEYHDKEKGKLAYFTQLLGFKEYESIDLKKRTWTYAYGDTSCGIKKDDEGIRNISDKALKGLDVLNRLGDVWNYVGDNKTIRGINVQQWRSCSSWYSDTNFTSDYYFTLDGQLPLRVEMKGLQRHLDGTIGDFHIIYDYILFNKVTPPPEVFEIQPGQVCANISKREPPPIVMSASFRQEEVDLASKRIKSKMIYFDKKAKYSLYEEKNHLTVHDYNRGVQFEINKKTQECIRKPISRFVDRDQTVDSNGLVHMETLKHFFYDDGDFTYNGVHKARGIPCNVYTKRFRSTQAMGVTVVEVYLAKGNMSNNIGHMITAQNQPVQVVLLRETRFRELKVIKQYDIFDFDPEFPEYQPRDLGACFSKKQTIRFTIWGESSVDVPWATKTSYQLAKSISNALGVSFFRVNIEGGQNDQKSYKIIGVLYERENATRMFQPVPNMRVVRPSDHNKYFTYKNKHNTPNICADYCVNAKSRPSGFHSMSHCPGFEFDRRNKDCTFFTGGIYDLTKGDENLKGSSHVDFYRSTWPNYNDYYSLEFLWVKLEKMVSQGLINCTDDEGNVFKMTTVSLRRPTRTLSEWFGKDSPLKQFKTIRGEISVQPVEIITKIFVEACARHCINNLKYNCKAYKYYSEPQKCYFYSSNSIRRSHSQQTEHSKITTYVRVYTSGFEKLQGRSMLSTDTDYVFTSVKDPNACAELCLKESDFYCQSFEICDDTCVLGRNHIYTAPQSNVKEDKTCFHYSRNFIQDYSKTKKSKALGGSNVVEVSNIGVKKCATLCSTSPTYNCDVFEFCDSDSICRLTTKSVRNTGKLVYTKTDNCDLYSRKSGRNRFVSSSFKQTSDSSGGHTPGEMGGIAIGMILLGIVMLAVVAVVVFRMRSPNRGRAGSMNVGFSRQQLDDN